MYFDAPMREGVRLSDAGAEAARIERIGFDAIWSFEIAHDPFFPLLEAALATERLRIGTNIAVAFARTPFSMAVSAWDLQAASRGRLLLGLGTQVRPHVERRFSAEFDHPAARIVDYVDCLRAIWTTFQTGARPRHEGRFYRFTLINDFFNPGPHRRSRHSDLPGGGESPDGRRRRGSRRRIQRAPHALARLPPGDRPPCPRRGRAKARQAGAIARPAGKLLRGARGDRARASESGTRDPAAGRVLRVDAELPGISRVPRGDGCREAVERPHARGPPSTKCRPS